ncbi:MAG: hypothetical protein R6U57_05710 [Anaerolineales bacterium]
MVKKIVLWSIYALFVGLLVWGAVNRTVAKSGADSGVRQEGLVGVQEGGRGLSGYGGGEGSIEGADSGDCESRVEGGEGNRGQGSFGGGKPSAGHSEIGPESVPENHEWLTVDGIIAAVDGEGMLVETEGYGGIEVTRRAWRFAQELGYAPQVGHEVKLEGFFEGGTFETAVVQDLTSGHTIRLRDETGRPLWAGGGR